MIDLEPIQYQLEYDEANCIHVTLDMCHGMYGVKRWAIRDSGACLNKNNEWEWEPLPSSRDDEFYARCRWDTAENALAFWRQGKHKSRMKRS